MKFDLDLAEIFDQVIVDRRYGLIYVLAHMEVEADKISTRYWLDII